MGYKVFFAFQMDIEDKFGKGFIQAAIEIAINKFKSEGVEVLLDFGFRGTPGTPLLIEEMLKKSSESDLVIVDLTFTSAKQWSNAELIDEDDHNSWYSIPKGKRKLSPNPNVLLETGYAWAKKGTYRTLAVMNEAFGSPDELPVDLKGFRWGITYNLNQANNSERKTKRKELGKNFYDAIKAAINAETSYQIEKWKPILIHAQWKKNHSFPFILTVDLKTKILELREKLINYKGPIRFTGLAGSGKTRLILEIFQENKDLKYNELNESILYHDYASELSGDISNQLFDLKYSEQSKIFIVDNCTLDKHNNLAKDFAKSKIKILSINTIDSFTYMDGANFSVEENTVNNLVQTIIMNKYSVSQSAIFIKNLDADLNRVIPIIESGINENDLAKSTIEILRLIIGKKHIDLGAFRLLTAISLFYQIGISGQYKNQLDFIKNVFVGCSENEIVELIELLEAKSLIKNKGDFIIINGFKEELMELWKSKTIDNLDDIIKGVSETQLWYHFKKPFFELLEQNPQLVTTLKDGLLTDEKFIATQLGAKFINFFADYYPEIAFDVITLKIKLEI